MISLKASREPFEIELPYGVRASPLAGLLFIFLILLRSRFSPGTRA